MHTPTTQAVYTVAEADQRMLLHGVAFEFSKLVCALDGPSPVRCIVAANQTTQR